MSISDKLYSHKLVEQSLGTHLVPLIIQKNNFQLLNEMNLVLPEVKIQYIYCTSISFVYEASYLKIWCQLYLYSICI